MTTSPDNPDSKPNHSPNHPPIRTDNDFFIGTDGQQLASMLPVEITTREQAYRTAAWIETMAATLPTETDQPPTFEQVREAIRNT